MTTMSVVLESARAFSTKHSCTSGHFEPRHSWAETETCRQARSLTPGTSSSRSPVAVSSAQVRNRRTSAPSRPGAAPSAGESKSVSSSAGKPPTSLCLQR